MRSVSLMATKLVLKSIGEDLVKKLREPYDIIVVIWKVMGYVKV